MAGLLLFELGLRLGLQLLGGGARPPPSRPPPPGCPLRVSRPSEFSSISWMRGGMEPGISIFSVITRSAPAGEEGQRSVHTPTPHQPSKTCRQQAGLSLNLVPRSERQQGKSSELRPGVSPHSVILDPSYVLCAMVSAAETLKQVFTCHQHPTPQMGN